jgi:hypothetical protein
MIGLAAAVLACGDGQRRERTSDPAATPAPMVTRGMTMAQVLQVWGPPDVRVHAGEGERWSYWLRDARSRPVGRAAYVLFDADKKVSEIITEPERQPRPLRRQPLTAA